jgi:hypothetical protein
MMHNSGVRRRLPAAVLLLAAACGPAPAEFPVGFFGVDSPADARALAAVGFSAIQSYQTEPGRVAAMAAATRREGQLLLISPNEVEVSTRPAREFPGVVWYIRDEPDLAKMSRDALAALDRKVRNWSPSAKTAFVVGDGHKAKDYPGVADVIMVDWYPVPHLPLESAGDHVRLTAEAAGGRKVWAVLQAFDWRNSPQHDPKKKRIGRFPTQAEIRFMSYDAVLNGASGIWYFAYSTATGSNLSQTPELFSAVTGPARELRAMAPVFARGRPIPQPFPIEPDGLSARAWTYHGRDYVVLANRSAGTDLLVPEALLAPAWRPLFEARRDQREALRSVDGASYLRQHQVLVLESRLRPQRLLGL